MQIQRKAKTVIFFSAAMAAIFALAYLILPKISAGIIPRQKSEPATPLKIYPKVSFNVPFADNLEISEADFPERVCNILDYGAIPGGETPNTEAIKKAIEDCAEQGGGRVTVPPGIWFTGPIKLKSNIDLEVQKDAKLLFSPNPDDYLPMVFSRFEGIEYYNYSPPIYAKDCENVAITGQGEIDGQGDKAWWSFSGPNSISKLYEMGKNNIPVSDRTFGNVSDGLRPAFAEFINCNIITIDGVTFTKGPMWTIHPVYSQNIIVKNVIINTAPGPSTDGVVIDSSQNVLVDSSTFSTGDDAIVLKSGRDADGRRVGKPSENILIQNSHIIDAHGAVAIGSEMSGGIRNVLAQNITVDDAQYGFRVKSNSDRGGVVENIWARNFNVKSLSQALVMLDMLYETNTRSGEDKYPPAYKNINVSDFACHDTIDSIDIFGFKKDGEYYMDGVSFKNIAFSKSRSRLKLVDAKNITLDGILMKPKYGPAFDLSNPQDLILSNSSCPKKMADCLNLTGNFSRNIRLSNNTFDTQTKKMTISKEVDRNELVIEIPKTNQQAPQKNPVRIDAQQ